MNVGIIGMGNIGTKYASIVLKNKDKFKLTAITRIKPESMNKLKDIFDADTKIYNTDKDLYEAYDNKEFELDMVIIATPHLMHEYAALEAFKRGIHVLCDKPAGVYLSQGRNMLENSNGLKYGYVFHQRMYPVNQKLKEIVDSNIYGKVKRVSYTVTDWYRPNSYYKSNAWRSTYKTDGGGTLLNQCPHSLDLLYYLFGNPTKVMAFCNEGKYHDIEVEDEATSYLEFKDGITATFIASTGELPGVNRLEISFEKALITCNKDEITIKENEYSEEYYRNLDPSIYKLPVPKISTFKVENNLDQYQMVIMNFYNAIINNEPIYANGKDALVSLYMSNAMYLSSAKEKAIKFYEIGSLEELEFEKEFNDWFKTKIKE